MDSRPFEVERSEYLSTPYTSNTILVIVVCTPLNDQLVYGSPFSSLTFPIPFPSGSSKAKRQHQQVKYRTRWNHDISFQR